MTETESENGMKLQLWIRGQDKDGHARLYRTITGEEFVAIFGVVIEHDGKRPWEREDASSAVSRRRDDVGCSRVREAAL